MDSWMDSQQKYWNSWADMAQRGMKAPEAPKNPLAEGLNQWWQAVSPMAPPTGRDVFDKPDGCQQGLLQHGRALHERRPEQQGWRHGSHQRLARRHAEDVDDWSQTGASFRPDSLFGGNQFKGLTTFWDLPMDTWNRLAANVMPMPGDFTQAFHPEGGNPVHQQVNKFLSIPAVGYSRESQEQYQILAQRQMDYMNAMQAYQTAFGKLGMETTTRFQQSLQARAKEDKTHFQPAGTV
jgi:class III poly(R)-hydroxyalkanoic acid synthase PhaE subunit